MDNRYGDNRYGEDRNRSRYGSDTPREDRDRYRSDRGNYGAHDRSRGGDDDRGFLDRAGDEVRSWFGDEEAEHRREADERRWERERAMSGGQDSDSYSNTAYAGRRGTAGGWGNQSGESWNRDRPGSAGSYGAYGSEGRGTAPASGRPGGFSRNSRSGSSREDHDPHYAEWRNRQIESLDRDYDEYRREHQSKFEQDFGSWRTKRGSQRQALGKVAEQMEVVGSDGQHIGTVDKVRGDRIILAKNDESSGGIHHSIPCSWVESVEDKVIVNRTTDEAMREWRDEERSRALNEREDSGSEGPHMLNRSFSGTY